MRLSLSREFPRRLSSVLRFFRVRPCDVKRILELHDSRIAVESKVDAGRRLEVALQATRVPRDGDMKALRAYVQLRIVNMAPGMHHSYVAKKALRWREDDQLRVIFPANSKTASRVTKAAWAEIRRRRREGLR